MARKTLAERFWSHVLIIDDEDSCWEWQRAKHDHGYGLIQIGTLANPNMEYAHRLSYILEHGSIPEGLDVLHTCDNPPCVRPKHLYAGTHDQNMRDMQVRGRANGGPPTGDANPKRLHPPKGGSTEQADEIRLMYATGVFSQRELGTLYGIGQQMVSRIVTGRSW